MQSVMRDDAFALQIGKNSACRGLLYRRAKPKAWHHPNRNAETRFNRVSNLFGGRKTFIPSPIDNFGSSTASSDAAAMQSCRNYCCAISDRAAGLPVKAMIRGFGFRRAFSDKELLCLSEGVRTFGRPHFHCNAI